MTSSSNTAASRPRLAVVFASTRQGRQGVAVAEWFRTAATDHGRFEIDFVDLAEVDLPLFDEPNHPRLQRYEHDHTKVWSERMAAADAFVFVTPEYDFAPPAALINAIQYLSKEWAYKPAGFVSYGGVSAGLRAVQVAKLVMTTVKLFTIPEAVSLPNYTQFLDDEGRLLANEIMTDSANAMLDELHKLDAALRTLREPAQAESDAA